MTMLDDVDRTFSRAFSPRSDLDELERLIGRLDDEPPEDGHADADRDAPDEPPDLFDDVDDVCRDD